MGLRGFHGCLGCTHFRLHGGTHGLVGGHGGLGRNDDLPVCGDLRLILAAGILGDNGVRSSGNGLIAVLLGLGSRSHCGICVELGSCQVSFDFGYLLIQGRNRGLGRALLFAGLGRNLICRGGKAQANGIEVVRMALGRGCQGREGGLQAGAGLLDDAFFLALALVAQALHLAVGLAGAFDGKALFQLTTQVLHVGSQHAQVPVGPRITQGRDRL